jgi:NAD(P)-dependent dehydrogenase (short-subunit alcohol dehydrogenase family)
MLEYYGADVEFSLEGKTAIITGGAAGIGFAAAEFFVAKGVNVVLADLNEDTDKIAGKLKGNAVGVSGNLTDGAYRERVLEKGVEAFGKVDILVNCAGIVALEKAEDMLEAAWDRTMEINLKASFMMAQRVGKYFIDNQIPGGIVNMASQAGVIALDQHVAYCASKGAIIAMTKVLAYEWGKYGIRVNAVSPTVVLTELGHKAWDGPVGETFKREMPSERFAEPDDIAGVIAFLCSGAAGMITGHNLLVDGGFTIK